MECEVLKLHMQKLRLSDLFSLAYAQFHQCLCHLLHTPPAETKHVSVIC